MKIMLSCLAFLMMLGCVTAKPSLKKDDLDKYKPVLGTWVEAEQKKITITFLVDQSGRTVNLSVNGDLRVGAWNYSNNTLLAFFPNMVGADGKELKDSAITGQFDAQGNLVLQSGGANLVFHKAGDAAPAPAASGR